MKERNPAGFDAQICKRSAGLVNLPHGQAYLTGVSTLRSREASEIPPSEVSCFVKSAKPLTQRLTELWPILKNHWQLRRAGRFYDFNRAVLN